MKIDLKFRFENEEASNDQHEDANLEDEVLTGFFFDQRLLALYSRNSTNYDYLRVYAYNTTYKTYVQLDIQESNFGR